VPAIVTLTTDFGTKDAFVGAMKGVLLARCPGAQLVDITHEVPPQAIRIGALRLAAAARYFPAGTIHVAVIDPGVGGPRRALAVESRSHFFVGPDNGVLSLAAVPSSVGWRAAEITNPAHRLDPVSNTFHGRDVLAPAAAHLAQGGSLEDLGQLTDQIVELTLPQPMQDGDVIRGVVLDVDRFENLVTNICAEHLAAGVFQQVSVRELTIKGLSTSYEASERAVAVIDSDGRLEIAMPGKGAAAELGVGPDEPVEVRIRPFA
jgi:S-adenosylmethionine hydrolase